MAFVAFPGLGLKDFLYHGTQVAGGTLRTVAKATGDVFIGTVKVSYAATELMFAKVLKESYEVGKPLVDKACNKISAEVDKTKPYALFKVYQEAALMLPTIKKYQIEHWKRPFSNIGIRLNRTCSTYFMKLDMDPKDATIIGIDGEFIKEALDKSVDDFSFMIRLPFKILLSFHTVMIALLNRLITLFKPHVYAVLDRAVESSIDRLLEAHFCKKFALHFAKKMNRACEFFQKGKDLGMSHSDIDTRMKNLLETAESEELFSDDMPAYAKTIMSYLMHSSRGAIFDLLVDVCMGISDRDIRENTDSFDPKWFQKATVLTLVDLITSEISDREVSKHFWTGDMEEDLNKEMNTFIKNIQKLIPDSPSSHVEAAQQRADDEIEIMHIEDEDDSNIQLIDNLLRSLIKSKHASKALSWVNFASLIDHWQNYQHLELRKGSYRPIQAPEISAISKFSVDRLENIYRFGCEMWNVRSWKKGTMFKISSAESAFLKIARAEKARNKARGRQQVSSEVIEEITREESRRVARGLLEPNGGLITDSPRFDAEIVS